MVPGTAGPGSRWLCRGTRKLGGGRWERDAELVVGVSGGLSCRFELIFLRDVVRSAPVDLGLPVFSVCFLFSSQTDFIHTIYLAMPARLWSLVLFWQRKFINFSRLPTHFPNVLGEKKMACFLWPHRRRNIARSAEFVAREADHFCRHSEKKRVPENVLNQSRRENGAKDRRVREYIGFIPGFPKITLISQVL